MTKNKKHVKYLLAAGVFFSLKSGPPSFEWSLFTDTELNTSEPDLTLMTQEQKEQNILLQEILQSHLKSNNVEKSNQMQYSHVCVHL